jgi:adenylyltransferase/sulfurtransferase
VRLGRGDDAAAAPRPTGPPRRRGAVERYSRQLVLPEWCEAAQLALREASVLVVGAGALGSPVATYLPGRGRGRLGIVDDDDVEVSNLHRQLAALHARRRRRQGRQRAAKLRFLNPEVVVEPYQARFAPRDARGRRPGRRLLDSFETRYEVNAACCAARIPLVEGGVLGSAAS